MAQNYSIPSGAGSLNGYARMLGEYRLAVPVDFEDDIFVTGLDLTTASELRIIWKQKALSAYGGSGSVLPLYSTSLLDLAHLRTGVNGYGWISLDSGYVQIRVTDFATGTIRMDDQDQGATLIAVQVWDT